MLTDLASENRPDLPFDQGVLGSIPRRLTKSFRICVVRDPLGVVVALSLVLAACATTKSSEQLRVEQASSKTSEQLRVEQAWSACQQEGRIPLQVRLTRIESNGRYRISGDARTFGFQDTQACMSEKFLLPVLVSPVADAVKVKVTNSTQYFSVGGNTASEILASLERNGPRQEEHRRAGRLTAGWTSGSSRVTVDCNPYTVTIHLDLVVTLPQHDHLDRLPEDLKLRWRRVVASVIAHEQRHVDIYVESARAVKHRIEALPISQPCPDIQQEIETIWTHQVQETKATQGKFDADEAERVEMDRKPLQTRIAANRARLTAIESEVLGLERTSDDIRRQLESLHAKRDAVVGRMRRANASPAGCPRARPNTSVWAVCQEHHDLIEASNELVRQYDGTVSHRNALVSEYNRLHAATTELVDASNWTW